MLEKKIIPLPLDKININDNFWRNYMELVRNHVIPYQWNALNDKIDGAEPSYCIQNFKVAAGIEKGNFQGMPFQDSDLYKWLEAVAYSLIWHKDIELESLADETIDLIGMVQQEDGYLDTYYIIKGLDKRFTNLMDNHELYCLGHMVEAATAYYTATGKKKFLEIAIRYVDCVDANLGREDEKKAGYPGHEIAEMALISLYKITHNEKHLKLAKYFVDQRGQSPLYFDKECKENNNTCNWLDSYFKFQYYQAGKPVRDQNIAEGHAVRAVYLYSGMADVASSTDDKSLMAACEKLWDNIVEKQMYVTGSIGSTAHGESFTFNYDLPNDTVYAETCASIGLIFFARRMFEITKDGRYTDVMERVLFNGVISGMSLDGQKFFYVNPLEVVPEACEKDYHKFHVKPERQKWFGCACCPPNIARLLSSIGYYAYGKNEKELFMNLFIGGDLEIDFEGKKNHINIETDYPWDGALKITITNEADTVFTYAIRIPAWCDHHSLTINNENYNPEIIKGYAYINRTWKSGDTIILKMDMPVKQIAANPRVREDIGKVALMRGPLVYCLEESDNGDQLQRIYLKSDSDFILKKEPDLLGGVTTIEANGKYISDANWLEHELYKPFTGYIFKDKTLKFIPYYAWTNREAGEMAVWIRI